MKKKTILLYNTLFLCFLYILIAFLFALIYIFLDFLNLGFIVDHYSSFVHQQQGIDYFTRSFYFSFTTLFSVGYGDLSPFGLSKGIAVIESLIGYTLPYAIVLNYFLFDPKITKRFLLNNRNSKTTRR
jgi:potassium channel LctB